MVAAMEEEIAGWSDLQPGPAVGRHYLVKCVLRVSAVLHAVIGHFRSPSSPDIVFTVQEGNVNRAG